MKKWMAMLLALTLLWTMVACGAQTPAVEDAPAKEAPAAEEPEETPAETPEETPAEAPEEEEDQPVSIEVCIVQNDWLDAWDVMEARFEEQYPWIDVESVGVGEEGVSFISTRNAANDLPDVVQIDNNAFWQLLVDENKVADLSGRDVCQYIPQSYLDSFTYNGKLIGITQGAAFSAMYFNMKILNEAGWEAPPANWTELLQCCADVQAAGYTPLALSGSYSVGIYMPVELIIANTVGETLGQGAYEEQFLNGTFDFTAYPELAEKWDALLPYVMTGSAGTSQDDLITAMADGNAAMCLGGNWVASSMLDAIATAAGEASLAVATLPPFQAEGQPCWISASPETGFGMTVDANRSAAEQEAVELFFDWLFLPENFMLIQNARGTVPVLSSMTQEHIQLPDSVAAMLGDMNAAPYVKMGFNLWTAVYSDTICTALCESLTGGLTGQQVVELMWETEQSSYFNQE